MSDARKPHRADRSSPGSSDLISILAQKIVGQPVAMNVIVPYVEMYRANLAPEGRPAGIFLLLGPTGTGKTRTVEALAEVLHGQRSKVLKINCGEFQMEHEVAKLIGAPPGYIGHRESQPMLTQARLTEVISEQCDLSLVLFDEIEKAAPSLTRLLLGVMDRAILQLGDGTSVNFEKSFMFLTSNLGAREMLNEINPTLGFHAGSLGERTDLGNKLEGIALAGVRKAFSPEFVNRIDAIITYQPLDEESLSKILDQHIAELQNHVNTRLGQRCFQIEVLPESRQFLLEKGTSAEFGARELKRTIHRHLTQPLATRVARGEVEPGSRLRVELSADKQSLILRTQRGAAPAVSHPSVLLVDDNRDLLGFLTHVMAQSGWKTLSAESVREAREVLAGGLPNAALVDYVLPDGNGVELAVELRWRSPDMHVIVMTGGSLTDEEQAICQEFGFPILLKPFNPSEVTNLIRNRLGLVSTAGA